MTATAKLTEAQIEAIRSAPADQTNAYLAGLYSVHEATISRARRGKAFAPAANGEGQIVPLPWIKPGDNPRTVEDLDALARLAASIAKHGVLQPVLLRPDPAKKGHYLIVAGHRRCRAAAMAKLTGVPAIVRDMDDWQAIMYALIENKERKDLSPLEEAAAFVTLQSAMTTEEIAEAYGCTPRHVQSRIRLRNSLCGQGKTDLINRAITLAQAEAISTEPDEHEQHALIRRCVSGELKTEADVRAAIQARRGPPKKTPARQAPPGAKPPASKQQAAEAEASVDAPAVETPIAEERVPPAGPVLHPAAEDVTPPRVSAADALRHKIQGFDITVFASPDYPLWEALEVELAGVKHCGDHEFPERLCLWNPETRQYRLYEIAGGST